MIFVSKSKIMLRDVSKAAPFLGPKSNVVMLSIHLIHYPKGLGRLVARGNVVCMSESFSKVVSGQPFQ